MKIALMVIGFPILLFISYLIYRARIGHLVAVHLFRFEAIYDKVFQETQSKEQALRHALPVFDVCPILNQLHDEDYDRIVDILKESPFPKNIINKIVLGFDTKTCLRAFKNDELLSKMAKVKNIS